MAKITDKFLNLLGFEVVEEEVMPDELHPAIKNNEDKLKTEDNWYNKLANKRQEKKEQLRPELRAVQNPAAAKMVISRPNSFNEISQVADHLCQNHSVVVDLTELSVEEARRVLDYLSGVVFAIDGKASRVGTGIFMFVPKNVSIEGGQLDLMLNAVNNEAAEQQSEDNNLTKMFKSIGA